MFDQNKRRAQGIGDGCSCWSIPGTTA